MLLYHVSHSEVNRPFTPRVPNVRMEGENSTMNRICVCDTLEGCFSAMPSGGAQLDILQEDTLGFYYVYTFDTETISEGNLMTPKELYQQDLVEDAELTGEYWILEEVQPIKKEVIFLEDWQENSADVYPHEVLRLIEEEHWDVYEAMGKVCPEREGIYSIVLISELGFKTDVLKPGEEVLFYGDCHWPDFSEEMMALSNHRLELSDESWIKAIKPVSLKEIDHWLNVYYA